MIYNSFHIVYFLINIEFEIWKKKIIVEKQHKRLEHIKAYVKFKTWHFYCNTANQAMIQGLSYIENVQAIISEP